MPSAWTNLEIELVAERAYQLHLQGRHEHAITIFEGLLAVDPRNLYCLESLAALSLKTGSAENAFEYANRALEFSPVQVQALACRCEANILLHRLTAAQQDLELMKPLWAARTHVARLTMRLANTEEFSFDLLADATSPEPDR